MLDRYSFSLILDRITEKYQEVNKTDKIPSLGIRYFIRLEHFLALRELDIQHKHLAYLSRN